MLDFKSILDALNAAQAAGDVQQAPQYPPEQERNLCAGTLLTLNSCCEPRALALGVGPHVAAATLQSAWDISGTEDLRTTIQVLLHEGQHLGMDPVIAEIHDIAKDGASDTDLYPLLVEAFGEDDADALRAAETSIVESVGLKDPQLTDMHDIHCAISTLRAWDLERAAFNARMGFEAGYIDENETLAILQQSRELAESTYDSWRSYGIAFVLGRVIGYSGDCNFMIGELGEQLSMPNSLYSFHPMGAPSAPLK